MIWRIGMPVKLVRPISNWAAVGWVGTIAAIYPIPKGRVLTDGSTAPIDGDCQVRWFSGEITSQAFWQLEPIVPEEKREREAAEVA